MNDRDADDADEIDPHILELHGQVLDVFVRHLDDDALRMYKDFTNQTDVRIYAYRASPTPKQATPFGISIAVQEFTGSEGDYLKLDTSRSLILRNPVTVQSIIRRLRGPLRSALASSIAEPMHDPPIVHGTIAVLGERREAETVLWDDEQERLKSAWDEFTENIRSLRFINQPPLAQPLPVSPRRSLKASWAVKRLWGELRNFPLCEDDRHICNLLHRSSRAMMLLLKNEERFIQLRLRRREEQDQRTFSTAYYQADCIGQTVDHMFHEFLNDLDRGTRTWIAGTIERHTNLVEFAQVPGRQLADLLERGALPVDCQEKEERDDD